jgi:hypothetical protein
MTKDIVETNNGTEELIDPAIEEVIDNVITLKKGSKKQRFHIYRMFNLPIITCAKLAGYKPSYGYQLVREYRNNPKVAQGVERILSDMPEAYRSVCRLRLAQVSDIEGKALDEYADDPKLAIEKPQLLKAVKAAAGVEFGEKDDVQPITINIKSIEKVQVAMADVLTKRLQDSKKG